MKTKKQLLACAAKLICLVVVALAGLNQTVLGQVTIQIVNDSGLPDSAVFVKAVGNLNDSSNANAPISPANLYVGNYSQTNPTAISLTNLISVATNVSLISGATNTVYAFQADNIASGSLYFTYNTNFTFYNGSAYTYPSPPPNSSGNALRYDYAEFSIDDLAAANNAMDITYVDKFGIPMQMEWFHGANTTAANLASGSYVYASTKTLANLFSSYGFSNAVFSLTAGGITQGWQYTGADSYTNFARILAPQKINGGGASSAPYSSVTNYLNYLTTHPFVLNGASVQSGYYYLGYDVGVVANTNGNDVSWTFTLTFNSNSIPPNYNVTSIGGGSRYTNTISFTVPNTNANPDASAYIYGAPVGTNLYSVNGTLVTAATVNSGTYPVEVWMIGDVLSALNFGFVGGNYGTNSDQWFSRVGWSAYPFGWAQPSPENSPDSGFYNAYAALMYYNADAYTFAFSERITPDVLVAPTNGDVVRITILPDDRLDSPVLLVPANTITNNAITLNWNSIVGAEKYQVNMLRPLGVNPVITDALNYTFTNLAPGTPYVVSVQAIGTNNGNFIITPARSVSVTTSGNYVPTNGSYTAISVGFNVTDPLYQLGQVYINGEEVYATNNWLLANGKYANWLASDGTNQVPITVYDNNGKLLFNDWLTFLLMSNSVTTTIANPVFYGQRLGQPLPTLSSPTFTTSTTGYNCTIGVTYVPSESRQYAPPLSTPPPANSAVTITGVTALPGGGIQFNFNVPAGTNYVVESSIDLLSATWQTNASGVGQNGGESYTTNSGNGTAQFYRIKL